MIVEKPELPLVALPTGLGHLCPSLSPPGWAQPGNMNPGENVYLKKMSKMTSETCLQTWTKWERPFYMFNWSNRRHALCLQISMILTMIFCPIKCVFDLSEDQMCVSRVQGGSYVHCKGKKTGTVCGHT